MTRLERAAVSELAVDRDERRHTCADDGHVHLDNVGGDRWHQIHCNSVRARSLSCGACAPSSYVIGWR